jgi:ABC-type multidrug transport system ATPase subunit
MSTEAATASQSVAADAPVLMQVAALAKRYGDQQVLADISFSVHGGEILGLIGPNGAGKTTLLETIAGILPADSGAILWRGRLLPPAERRQVVFYLPDGVRPWQDEYVQRVLLFVAGVYRKNATHVAQVIATVGLEPVMHKRVLALSKGYARRLMWALALLAPHPLLLMDEPFDGFDLRQTRQMAAVLRQTIAAGRTLLLSIHQLLDAQRVCDRFVLLADGRVGGVGRLADLRARAQQPAGNLEEVFLALT